jgi:hypothetical protein
MKSIKRKLAIAAGMITASVAIASPAQAYYVVKSQSGAYAIVCDNGSIYQMYGTPGGEYWISGGVYGELC